MRLLIATLAMATAAAAAPSRLEENIVRITRSINAQWGIYIKCLETGGEVAIEADRQMGTMSTIKIRPMAEAFRQIESGSCKRTGRGTLEAAARRPVAGGLRGVGAGAP